MRAHPTWQRPLSFSLSTQAPRLLHAHLTLPSPRHGSLEHLLDLIIIENSSNNYQYKRDHHARQSRRGIPRTGDRPRLNPRRFVTSISPGTSRIHHETTDQYHIRLSHLADLPLPYTDPGESTSLQERNALITSIGSEPAHQKTNACFE